VAISEIGAGAIAQGASGNTLQVTHGMTLVNGDVLIATVACNDNLNAIASSSSFTEVWNADGAPSGNTNQNSIWRRVVDGSEASTFTWTQENSQAWGLVVRQFRGVHADIWDVTPSATTRAASSSAGTTATSTDMTIVTAGALGLAFLWTDYTGAMTYSGPTNSWGTALSCETNWPLGTYLRACASSGAIGTAQWTLSASQDWEVMLAALKPAIGVVTTGLVAEYVGKLAKNGTAPGNNTDPTSTWDDLKETFDSTASAGYAWTTSSGWKGAGSAADPYRLQHDLTDAYTDPGFWNVVSDKSFSFEAWIETPAALVTTQVIMSEGQTASTTAASTLLRLVTTGSALYPSLAVYDDSNVSALVQSSGTTLSASTLYHIIGVCDVAAGYGYLYVGGSIISAATVSIASLGTLATASKSCIGARYRGSSTPATFLGGAVATARVYNVALTSAEVAQNYAAGVLGVATAAAASDRTCLIQFGIC